MSSLSPSFSGSPQDRPPEAGRPGSADATWIREARGIVGDLYRRSPLIYWTDLLLSAGAGWALVAVYFTAPAWSAAQLVAFVAASLLLYRAGTFMHELVHLPADQLRGFGPVWNLIVGVPLLAPWIFYRNHVDHHSAKSFGTPEDGEYLPLAVSPLRETAKFLVQAPLLPLLAALRFGLLAPLSWLHRGLREWTLTAATAGVINPYYRKRFPARDEGHLLIVEALCLGYLLTLALLLHAGVITGRHLMMGYVLLAWTLAINWVRTLAAHRYVNRGDALSLAGQFQDSVNITGQTWLSALLFPVGLRYHATHHLFPSMPYHNLGVAHRRLSERLPLDSPYHAAGRRSFFAAVAELLNGARQTSPQHSAMPRWRHETGRS